MVIDPTTGQLAPSPPWAVELAEAVEGTVDDWADEVELPDGRSVSAKLQYDAWHEPIEDEECYGQLEWVRPRGDYGELYSRRPGNFDGRACKIDARSRGREELWWQPPDDCPPGSDCYNALKQRITGWYRDDWTYCVLAVRTTMPPCGCCGDRSEQVDHLGGVESDADPGYLADLIDDMVAPLRPPAAHRLHGEPII